MEGIVRHRRTARASAPLADQLSVCDHAAGRTRARAAATVVNAHLDSKVFSVGFTGQAA